MMMKVTTMMVVTKRICLGTSIAYNMCVISNITIGRICISKQIQMGAIFFFFFFNFCKFVSVYISQHASIFGVFAFSIYIIGGMGIAITIPDGGDLKQ